MIEKYRKNREQNLLSEESGKQWFQWNLRYIKTYKSIVGNKFKSKILDVGCGPDYFSKTCCQCGYEAEGIDIDRVNFETDKLPYRDNTFQVVHVNAVIEHIRNPENLLHEIKRVLKKGGIVIINTPNWQMDFKNFYNDPTHQKPYTPQSLRTVLEMYGYKVLFLEPALICKPKFYWNLPSKIKWRLASLIRKGSKSILAVAEK